MSGLFEQNLGKNEDPFEQQRKEIENKKNRVGLYQAQLTQKQAALARQEAEAKEKQAQEMMAQNKEKDQSNNPVGGPSQNTMNAKKNSKDSKKKKKIKSKKKKSKNYDIYDQYHQVTEEAYRALYQFKNLKGLKENQSHPAEEEQDKLDLGDQAVDTSALKNDNVLRTLGFNINKDEELEKADEELADFQKRIPKIREVIKMLKARKTQDDYSRLSNTLKLADKVKEYREKEVDGKLRKSIEGDE